jgi:hypothetical protein
MYPGFCKRERQPFLLKALTSPSQIMKNSVYVYAPDNFDFFVPKACGHIGVWFGG